MSRPSNHAPCETLIQTRRRGLSAPVAPLYVEVDADSNLMEMSDCKQTPFIQKTYAMIDTHDVICWLPCGLGFLVKDANMLAIDVLPKFFKHGNFASFVRQLHFYGFSKTSLMNGGSEFRHPNFIFGRTDLLHLISRKSTDTITKQRSQIDELQQQVLFLRQQNEHLLLEHRRMMSLVSGQDNSCTVRPVIHPHLGFIGSDGVQGQSSPSLSSSGQPPMFNMHVSASPRDTITSGLSSVVKPVAKAVCFSPNQPHMFFPGAQRNRSHSAVGQTHAQSVSYNNMDYRGNFQFQCQSPGSFARAESATAGSAFTSNHPSWPSPQSVNPSYPLSQNGSVAPENYAYDFSTTETGRQLNVPSSHVKTEFGADTNQR